MAPILEVEDLHVAYGATRVLHGIAFRVATGGITTILGANGAGKTTTLRAVCGMARPVGTIRLDGRRIDGRATEDIARLGVAHVPEGRGTFVGFTVEENLRLGAYVRKWTPALDAEVERAYEIFPVLAEKRRVKASELSGGQQQMLEMARALLLKPRLMLLDEPTLGLAPLVFREIFRIIEALRREGQTILMVEQNAAKALEISDYAFVLELGQNRYEGPGEVILNDPRVKQLYLGR